MAADKPLIRVLEKIVTDPTLHARWLNTFSYLEYIGFRKIVKSQEAETLTLATLTHANEEGRHAMLLKRLALRIGGKEFDNYHSNNLLCGEAAEDYFQTLDHLCEASFSGALSAERRARLTYLYVTWLVEVRALDVYQQYQAAAQDSALKGLLAEEAGHLQHVEARLQGEDPEFATRGKALKEVETELYHRYLRILQNEIFQAVEQPSAH
jgi:hypothetical protein